MRREEYTQRLINEWKMNDFVGSFITLTYRDDDLPKLLPEGYATIGSWFKGRAPDYNSTLSRKDLSQFCDKMQKALKRKYSVSGKYIAVGEYGDEEHRPHYHAIYIGLPTGDRKLLYDTWSNGIVDIKPISHADIRYTLSYIDKQMFTPKILYEEYGDFEPPFAHFSKGIGVTWIKENLKKFDQFGTIHFTEKKSYTLNPYYRDKFGFDKKYQHYSDSVLKFASDRHIKDLEAAKLERDSLTELSLQHKELHKFGYKIDLPKEELINATYKLQESLSPQI